MVAYQKVEGLHWRLGFKKWGFDQGYLLHHLFTAALGFCHLVVVQSMPSPESDIMPLDVRYPLHSPHLFLCLTHQTHSKLLKMHAEVMQSARFLYYYEQLRCRPAVWSCSPRLAGSAVTPSAACCGPGHSLNTVTG